MSDTFDCLLHVRLRASRYARGYISRKAFAAACNLPVTTIRGHELGESEPKASDIFRYIKLLKISANWLLTGEGSPLEQDTNTDPQQAVFYHWLKAEMAREQFLQAKVESTRQINIKKKASEP